MNEYELEAFNKIPDKYRKYFIMDLIKVRKKKLSDTDYQAIKYAECEMTEAEYAPIKSQRRAWRVEINELEAKL